MKVIYNSQKIAPSEQNINSSKYTAPLGLCAGVDKLCYICFAPLELFYTM